MLTKKKLETLLALAEKACKKVRSRKASDYSTLHVAVARKKADPDSFNRLFGAPLGVTDKTWPRFKPDPNVHGKDAVADNRMEHVFTVDLRDVTLARGIPKGAQAASFFLSNTSSNSAYTEGSGETVLYFWGAKDVARGFYEGELPRRKYPKPPGGFDLAPVKVPNNVFLDSEVDKDKDLKALHSAIFRCGAWLGGSEFWVQDPEQSYDDDDWDDDGDDGDDDEPASEKPKAKAAAKAVKKTPEKPLIQELGLKAYDFVMQFNETFADVNLGDSGMMYVSGGTSSFWQCY